MIRSSLALAVLVACGGKSGSSTTPAAAGCPPAVTAAVTQAYPDGKQGTCAGEAEGGLAFYEVAVTRRDGTVVELELLADGTIHETSEVVAVAAIPEPVAKAFAAKYPGATATKVERVTVIGKPVAFEIAFGPGKEAVFAENGDFVEEEGDDGNDKDNDDD